MHASGAQVRSPVPPRAVRAVRAARPTESFEWKFGWYCCTSTTAACTSPPPSPRMLNTVERTLRAQLCRGDSRGRLHSAAASVSSTHPNCIGIRVDHKHAATSAQQNPSTQEQARPLSPSWCNPPCHVHATCSQQHVANTAASSAYGICRFPGSKASNATGGFSRGAPEASAVLGANEDVVAAGVDMHGRDDAAAGEQRLREGLLGEVVDADVGLARDEQQRLGRVELAASDLALALPERRLAAALAQLMHDHALRRPARTRRHEVVPPAATPTSSPAERCAARGRADTRKIRKGNAERAAAQVARVWSTQATRRHVLPCGWKEGAGAHRPCQWTLRSWWLWQMSTPP